MNLKKILRTGLVAIGLSALTLTPLTAQNSESLDRKLNPTSLMAISARQHPEEGIPIILLAYDTTGDGIENARVVYNFVSLPNSKIILEPKESYHDLNKNGKYDEDEKFLFETNDDKDLSRENPVDFLKQLGPKYVVSMEGKEGAGGVPEVGLGYCTNKDGVEDARIIYSVASLAGNAVFVEMKEYYLDLNRDGEYSEDEKFLVGD